MVIVTVVMTTAGIVVRSVGLCRSKSDGRGGGWWESGSWGRVGCSSFASSVEHCVLCAMVLVGCFCGFCVVSHRMELFVFVCRTEFFVFREDATLGDLAGTLPRRCFMIGCE